MDLDRTAALVAHLEQFVRAALAPEPISGRDLLRAVVVHLRVIEDEEGIGAGTLTMRLVMEKLMRSGAVISKHGLYMLVDAEEERAGDELDQRAKRSAARLSSSSRGSFAIHFEPIGVATGDDPDVQIRVWVQCAAVGAGRMQARHCQRRQEVLIHTVGMTRDEQAAAVRAELDAGHLCNPCGHVARMAAP